MDSLLPAVDLIKEFEGCKLTAYKDIVGIPTIGYGTTEGVHMGTTITMAQAISFLMTDVARCASRIKTMLKQPITDNELCAMISLSYNIGLGGLEHSTMLRLFNAGAPKQEVANAFLAWDHAGGVVVPGLERRRAAEAALFLK